MVCFKNGIFQVKLSIVRDGAFSVFGIGQPGDFLKCFGEVCTAATHIIQMKNAYGSELSERKTNEVSGCRGKKRNLKKEIRP